MTALRGQVYRVDLGYGPKPWLVVSNNVRNRNLDSVVAARVTTTLRHAHVPTVVRLAATDPVPGVVLCDDLVQLYADELTDLVGALGPESMRAVSAALRIALP